MATKPDPSGVTNDEWEFVAPPLALIRENSPQRAHGHREILRIAAGRAANPTAVVIDIRTLQSTPESGLRGAYDGAKDHRISLHVVNLSEAERGFVLLPWRWVVERSFAWMTRFRRLAKTGGSSCRGARMHHARAVLRHGCMTRSMSCMTDQGSSDAAA